MKKEDLIRMIKATKPNQTEVLPMNQFNKEIAQTLLENTNLTEVFRNQLESTMNSLLESELTAILGYDPYVRFNNGNYHSWLQDWANFCFSAGSIFSSMISRTPPWSTTEGTPVNRSFSPYSPSR